MNFYFLLILLRLLEIENIVQRIPVNWRLKFFFILEFPIFTFRNLLLGIFIKMWVEFFWRCGAFYLFLYQIVCVGHCVDATCPLLVNSPHSTTDPDCPPLAAPGVMCTQRCLDGYVMTSGSPSRTCTIDLEWSGEDIVCTGMSCDVIALNSYCLKLLLWQ